MRDLTPIGRITILKSLGLSQLIFLLSVLPKPPEGFLQEIDSLMYSFIWNGKPDKINRHTIIGDYSQGGLKMLHLPSVITGLKIAWVKRIIDVDNTGKWKCFFEYYLKHLGGDLFWLCNLKTKDPKIYNVGNSFIREILLSWSALTFSDNLIVTDFRTSVVE